jgi:molecular chaperone DnaJ
VIISDPCDICRGQGRIPHTSKLLINVPPGADDGLVLRYSGAGEAGIKGGPPGDLHVVVHIREHPVFRRRGDDLICEVSIAFTQAALGAQIEVPIIVGKAKLTIPPGTQSGKVFSLRGRGVPHLRGRGTGDQFVKVLVRVPTKLTDKEENLIRELAELRGERVVSADKKFFEKVRDAFS